jgi:hypothetical protein
MEFHYSYESSSLPFGFGAISIGGYLPIFLIVQVFFALTLRKVLLSCAPENRKTNPDYVWLNLIPIFNLIWPFILNPKICASIQAEFMARGWPEKSDFGRTLGWLYPALTFSIIIPIIGLLGILASLILFILFWVKMAQFKSRLAPPPNFPPHQPAPNPPNPRKS